jgi:hypothetical protein
MSWDVVFLRSGSVTQHPAFHSWCLSFFIGRDGSYPDFMQHLTEEDQANT